MPLTLRLLAFVALALCESSIAAPAQQPDSGPRREFAVGSWSRLDELPPGRLRQDIDLLPDMARERARQWLQGFHFTDQDIPSLHVDPEGGIRYACGQRLQGDSILAEPPVTAQASVPISPFPAHLIYHSRPGAPNILYLNFTGETVTGTVWNNSLGRAEIAAVAFSTDSDYSTFSDAEQLAIRRIWQRVSEDYAPFNIDVTTERPATFTTRTAHAVITRTTDANGLPNPDSGGGGVAYVNVFGSPSYANYRPAWIYFDNLAYGESYIAEAAAHEIGHNMGLSHDGKTDGTEYYAGHGSGDTSWAPIMGGSYNRNVTQWSKGEYYMANNTQDDIATIAAKISYRTDDHGGTFGTATMLSVTGARISATTPETDPFNTNTVNKGVLDRGTDVDVFWFVTGAGPVSLSIQPWIVPSAVTRGGNVDLQVELYTESGMPLLTNNPAIQTTALIQTNLPQGRYFLFVRTSGAGTPLATAPSGYTAYGGVGQYFITGQLVAASNYVVAPRAELQVANITQTGQGPRQFSVTYSDDAAVNVSSLDSADCRVLGPRGYDRMARFVSVDASANGTPRIGTYAIDPPSGATWMPADNGIYTIWMRTNQVGDTEGAWVAAGQLGQFTVGVPVALYSASMDLNPGWTLDPQWQYGQPNYGGAGPSGGFTGTSIIGYNLSGNYPNNLSVKYATTPVINCSGASSLTLRFRRWLRLARNDTALIQVSTNGSAWSDVWSATRTVSDSSWQEVQYSLPVWASGSPTVRIRWALASNQSQNDIGWNIDDVEVLGDGVTDSAPPIPVLSIADLTQGGSPSHSCSVTYADATALRISTLDSLDIQVTGPNGYSNRLDYIGADLSSDGAPCTASYSIPAPGGSWDIADNGTYSLALVDGEVEDILNNATSQISLGNFNVAISAATPGVLSVSPEAGLAANGTAGGPFSPASMTCTLSNAGGSTLAWSASASQEWIGLSLASGSLPAGGSVNVNVTINTVAHSLAAGNYTGNVSFVNTTSGSGTTSREVALTVNRLPVSITTFGWGLGQFQARFVIQPGQSCVIQVSTNLAQWQTLESRVAGSDGVVAFSDPAASTSPFRFYSVVLPSN